MIVIGATAVPEERIVSITKHVYNGTTSAKNEYTLQLKYEGAGGESLVKNIKCDNLAELDNLFNSATCSNSSNRKYFQEYIGDKIGATFQEGSTGKRSTVRVGYDSKIWDIKSIVRQYKDNMITGTSALEEMDVLVNN